jgi:hypothetical protein
MSRTEVILDAPPSAGGTATSANIGKRSLVFVSRETGTFWCAGWLFTIGFAHLTFWKGVLGLVIWPYYLGRLLAG